MSTFLTIGYDAGETILVRVIAINQLGSST